MPKNYSITLYDKGLYTQLKRLRLKLAEQDPKAAIPKWDEVIKYLLIQEGMNG